MSELKVGAKVTTRFGEELVVKKVEERAEKKKKGVVIQEPETWFLAQSGEQDCWFPQHYIKEDN